MSQQESMQYLPVDLLLRWTNLQARIVRYSSDQDRAQQTVTSVLEALADAWRSGYTDGAARMSIQAAADNSTAALRRTIAEEAAPKPVVVGERLRVVDDADGALVHWGVVTQLDNESQPCVVLEALPVGELVKSSPYEPESPRSMYFNGHRVYIGTELTVRAEDGRLHKGHLMFPGGKWSVDGHVISVDDSIIFDPANPELRPTVGYIGGIWFNAGDVLKMAIRAKEGNRCEFTGPLTFNPIKRRWEVDGVYPEVSSIITITREEVKK